MIIYDQSNTNGSNAHVMVMRRWYFWFLGAEISLISFSIGCFLLFLFLDNLWWTIVTNNVCIILTEVLYAMYRTRVSLAITRIHEDQHKVGIFKQSYSDLHVWYFYGCST